MSLDQHTPIAMSHTGRHAAHNITLHSTLDLKGRTGRRRYRMIVQTTSARGAAAAGAAAQPVPQGLVARHAAVTGQGHVRALAQLELSRDLLSQSTTVGEQSARIGTGDSFTKAPCYYCEPRCIPAMGAWPEHAAAALIPLELRARACCPWPKYNSGWRIHADLQEAK